MTGNGGRNRAFRACRNRVSDRLGLQGGGEGVLPARALDRGAGGSNRRFPFLADGLARQFPDKLDRLWRIEDSGAGGEGQGALNSFG